MTEKMHDPEDELQRLWIELAESGAILSDEELLAEVRDGADDPAVIVTQARAAIDEATKEYRQRALIAAREERSVRLSSLDESRRRFPESHQERRRLLGAVLSRQPTYAALTAQWRDLQSIPDADVDGLLEQLDELGALSETPGGEGNKD